MPKKPVEMQSKAIGILLSFIILVTAAGV